MSAIYDQHPYMRGERISCDSHFQLICTGQQILTKGKTTVLEVHISRLYLCYIYIYEGLSKCGEKCIPGRGCSREFLYLLISPFSQTARRLTEEERVNKWYADGNTWPPQWQPETEGMKRLMEHASMRL